MKEQIKQFKCNNYDTFKFKENFTKEGRNGKHKEIDSMEIDDLGKADLEQKLPLLII